MKPKPKRPKAKRPVKIDPWLQYILQHGGGVVPEAELREAWDAGRDEILDDWCGLYLFHRPAAWWRFDRPDLTPPRQAGCDAFLAETAAWWLANAPGELTRRERAWIRHHRAEVEAAGQEAEKSAKVLSIDKGQS